MTAKSRLGEPVGEGAEPESEPVAESIEAQAQEGIPEGTANSDVSSSQENGPLQIMPEGVQITDHGNNGHDSKSAFEWNCLGNVYLKAGSYDEAVSAYTKAIELAPKVGWPYRNLASAYFYKGMTAVAIPLFKRSIELLSNSTEKASSLNKLGDAYRQLGDYQNAMVSYQKADDLSAGINSLLNKARMLVSDGGPRAKRLLTTVRHTMRDYLIWNEFGNIYQKTASYDEAIEAYSKAIELAPNFGWPYQNLASAYLSKGLFSEAIPLLQKSIDLLRSNSEKAISFSKLGDAYRQMGDYQNALAAFQQADAFSADPFDRPAKTEPDETFPAVALDPTITKEAARI